MTDKIELTEEEVEKIIDEAMALQEALTSDDSHHNFLEMSPEQFIKWKQHQQDSVLKLKSKYITNTNNVKSN